MERVTSWLVGLFLVFAAVVLIDAILAVPVFVANGTVIERVYTPESTATGVGSGVSSNGSPTTVVTTEHTPEKWTVIVDMDGDRPVVAATADPDLWAKLKPGESCSVFQEQGSIVSLGYQVRQR